MQERRDRRSKSGRQFERAPVTPLPRVFRVDWEGVEQPMTPDGWKCQQGEDCLILRAWLAPGQMELYRIEGARQDRPST